MNSLKSEYSSRRIIKSCGIFYILKNYCCLIWFIAELVHRIFSKKQVKTFPHCEIKKYGITFDLMDRLGLLAIK
jgi:hypothetical protein